MMQCMNCHRHCEELFGDEAIQSYLAATVDCFGLKEASQ